MVNSTFSKAKGNLYVLQVKATYYVRILQLTILFQILLSVICFIVRPNHRHEAIFNELTTESIIWNMSGIYIG